MEDPFNRFLQVIDALNKHNVEYILIGGVAIIFHGMPRLTNDIDFFVRLTLENLEKLRRALYSVFIDDSIEEITLDELTDYPVIRYGTPDDFYIDIMARIGVVTTFENLDYEIVEYEGIEARIATPETLFRLKKDTMRDKDKMDLFFLNELIQSQK